MTIEKRRKELELPANPRGRPTGGSAGIAARNAEIREKRRNGATYPELAAEYGISKASVAQILSSDV